MEIKPGKWRLADGREVVVLARDDRAVLEWHPPDRSAIWWTQDRLDDAEYLGSAVIGEVTADDPAYPLMMAREYERKCKDLEKQCKDLEAETVSTRELLEKSEERCEELAKQLAESDEAFRRRALLAPNSGDPPPYWLSGVSCEVEGDLVIHRYKSVTVMVRGEREAWCYCSDGRWFALCERMEGSTLMRQDAEAWCREQLEPKRRKAGTEDVGSACWVKDNCDTEWSEAVLICCDFLYANPYVAAQDGYLFAWDECEVQD